MYLESFLFFSTIFCSITISLSFATFSSYSMLKLFYLFIVYFVVSNLCCMSILALISLCLSRNLVYNSIFFSYIFTNRAFSYFSTEIIFFFNFKLSSSIFITYVFSSSCFFRFSYTFSSFSNSSSFCFIDSFNFDSLACLFV